MTSAFVNEPLLELRRAPERDALTAALAELDRELPLRVPVLIAGDERTGPTFASTDPGTPERVVAEAVEAGPDDAEAAVAATRAAFPEWSARPAAERRAVLARAAGVLRSRRSRLAALAVRECGKPWAEADGDVCEAIDFLEYYGLQALLLDRPPELVQVPGERNEMRYAGRGVVAVIAPWNFPLAIACGMVAAGLAAGNAVVLKPAEQAPACAAEIVAALHAAGVPPAALALLPGAAEPGAALVRHPDVQTIAFTGSNAVGLEIVEAAARCATGQRDLKRVVAEMGGKNCVLVDADADLDEAVPAILASAYGFAGQKCSAASVVLAHEAIADTLADRLTGALETLVVGQAETFGIDVPPVIERSARERVARYREAAARDGALATGGGELPAQGWFCPPALATDLPEDAPLLHEEVFGPLCALRSVPDLDAACDFVERSRFALTCGLFTRDPATVEAVWRRSPVGNLYVNREITGAMVGRQPFGGNRLSGNGTKAGGPDYLHSFVEPRVVCENTVRHGLVV